MKSEDIKFLERINQYADEVLGDIDPQKVQVSVQLEKLKPIMVELAAENDSTLEDTFIRYMDLASEAGREREEKFKSNLDNYDIEI